VGRNIKALFQSSSARSIFSYGLGPLLGLITGPILAITLKPAGRGQFASVMEPITIAAAFATFGVPTAVSFFISRGADPRGVIKLSLLTAALPTLLTCMGLWAYSGPVSTSQNLPRVFVVAAWTAAVISVFVQVKRSYWQGLAGWFVLDLDRSLVALLRFLGIVICVFLGFTDAKFFVVAALVAFVVAVSSLWWPWERQLRKNFIELDTKYFVRYSFFGGLGSIAMVANNRLDQLLMPAQATSVEVGFYAVAVTVAEVPLIFASLASREILVMSAAGNSVIAILRKTSTYFIGVAVSSLLLGIGSFLYVPLFFGTEFGPSIPAVQILSITAALTTIALCANSFIAGKGAPTYSSLVPVSGLVMTLICFKVGWNRVDATVASQISLISQGSAAIVGVALTWLIFRRSQR
jgi:O-antigen/teichoic acid export membrane protein